LYTYLKENNKTVFVNANDDKQLEYSEGITSITFGDKNQDCFIELADASKQVSVTFKSQGIKSNLIGLYNFNNIAAAICIGNEFNVPEAVIKSAIESYTPTNNRSQLIKKGSNQIILDAYNANPSSMMAALENFNQTEGESKILFLGDMFELGTQAEKEHQNIVNFIEDSDFIKVYLIGENFFKTKIVSSKIEKLKTFEALQNELKVAAPTHSQILIKASRGMALERILDII
jgi:UDP-N-acetylmuramoyl-tripeptide--D-alanyl-D-alanine ligase